MARTALTSSASSTIIVSLKIGIDGLLVVLPFRRVKSTVTAFVPVASMKHSRSNFRVSRLRASLAVGRPDDRPVLRAGVEVLWTTTLVRNW